MSKVVEAGFSVLEVLIAATLVAATIVTLVALLMRSAEQAVRTEIATTGAVLAQAKLEQLRTATFAFDAAGVPVDGPALALSPANSHLENTPGYFESLGRFGEPLAAEPGASYLRRWSIGLFGGVDQTRRLVVCVMPQGSRASAVRPTCMWTVRTRQP